MYIFHAHMVNARTWTLKQYIYIRSTSLFCHVRRVSICGMPQNSQPAWTFRVKQFICVKIVLGTNHINKTYTQKTAYQDGMYGGRRFHPNKQNHKRQFEFTRKRETAGQTCFPNVFVRHINHKTPENPHTHKQNSKSIIILQINIYIYIQNPSHTQWQSVPLTQRRPKNTRRDAFSYVSTTAPAT